MRLPFGRFHLLVIVALGITWILDGLEVTLAGALAGELKEPAALGLSNAQVGLAGSCYLCGAVAGALFFGWLTDRLGRKKLFTVTLAVYLLATAATGFVLGCLKFHLVPDSSPGPASAASTPPSIRQSRSLSRRGSAAGPTF